MAAKTAEARELHAQLAAEVARLTEMDGLHAQLLEVQQAAAALTKRVAELEGWKAAKQLEAKDAAEPEQSTPWATVVRRGRSTSSSDSANQPDVMQFQSAVRQEVRQAQQEADRAANIVIRNLPAGSDETLESLSASVHEVLKDKLHLASSEQLVQHQTGAACSSSQQPALGTASSGHSAVPVGHGQEGDHARQVRLAGHPHWHRP